MSLSIRYQILGLMTTILLVSMGSYLWVATNMVSKDKLAYVYDTTSALAYTKSEEVHSSLKSFVDKLIFLSAQPVDGSSRQFNQLVESLLKTDPDILDLEIWDRTGGKEARVYSVTNEARLDALGIAPQDLITLRSQRRLPFDAIVAERVMLANNSIPPETAILTIAAAGPGNRRVVVADTHPERLLRLFVSSKLYTTYVIDQQGTVLLHSKAAEVVARRSGQGHPVVEASFDANVRRGVREYDTGEEVVLGAFAHVDLGRLSVIAEIPKGIALQAAQRLNRQSWLFAGAVVLFALIASIFFGQRIVTPIRRLQAATGEIARGAFGLQVPVTSRNEIGALASDFNEMSNHLADRESRYMTMVGTLAGGIAHEINNPLTYILNNIDYALDTTKSENADGSVHLDKDTVDEIAHALADAEEGAKRVQSIVRDLRSFAGTDRCEADPVNVQEAMEKSISIASSQIRYQCKIERSYEPVPPVAASHAQLGQVFLNLLVNAAHALQDGPGEEKLIRVSTELDVTGQVVVRVSDTGAGISAQLLPRIFEPFFTTRPFGSGAGSGLGLAIAHSLMAQLGGRIQVESEVGKGTTFSLFLPVADRAGSQAEEAVVRVPQTDRTLRVLLIDDDPRVASALSRLLDTQHEVTTVDSGAGAIERLVQDPDFDVIFCDVMMPEVSGIDVYRAVSKANAQLARRFIFMTGGAFTTQAQTFLKSVSNINPSIGKPFNRTVISQALGRCLHNRDAP